MDDKKLHRFSMRVRGLILVALCALPPMAVPAPTIVLAAGDGYPPFSDASLPDGGLVVKLVKHAVAAAGREVQIEFAPWAEAYRKLVDGSVSGVFPYPKDENAESMLYYSKSLYTVTTGLFTKRDSEIVFERDEDLRGLRVCKSSRYGMDELRGLVAKKLIHLQRPPYTSYCFRLLVDGETDLVVETEHTGWAVAQKFFRTRDVESRVKFLPRALQRVDLHLVIRKSADNAQEVLEAVNRGIDRMRDDGSWNDVAKSYLKLPL